VQELLIELQKSTGPYSFAGAEINGAKLKISLREGIPAPEMDANSQRPAHLVAAVSGTVEELIVLRGEAAVKKGDRVQKGDVLVRGVLTALWDGRFVDFTNAAAIVHIAQDVEVEGEVDLAEIQLLPTGKSKSRVLVEIRDFTICLQYGKIVYNTYIEETQNLKLPGWMEKLGLGLRIETLKEARSVPAMQSENQAIRKLAEGFLNPGETLGRVEVLWQEARGNIRRYGLKLRVIRQDVEQVYLTQEEMAAIRANTKPR